MAKHIACLTFDFDTTSGWVARGLVTPTPMSRGEFGVVGAARILDLLEKYNLRATWFIPGVVIEAHKDICKRVVDQGHEIGLHGWTHVPPADLSREKEEEGVLRGNDSVERLCGKKALGYRSPSWDLSPHTVELLIKHGVFYDSSMMGNDFMPYRARQGDVIDPEEPVVFGPETKLIEMPISWTLDDYPHFEFVRTKDYVLPGLMSAVSPDITWSPMSNRRGARM